MPGAFHAQRSHCRAQGQLQDGLRSDPHDLRPTRRRARGRAVRGHHQHPRSSTAESRSDDARSQRRSTGLLLIPARPLAISLVHQPPGERQQRDQTPRRRRWCIPQPRSAPTPHRIRADRATRRMDRSLWPLPLRTLHGATHRTTNTANQGPGDATRTQNGRIRTLTQVRPTQNRHSEGRDRHAGIPCRRECSQQRCPERNIDHLEGAGSPSHRWLVLQREGRCGVDHFGRMKACGELQRFRRSSAISRIIDSWPATSRRSASASQRVVVSKSYSTANSLTCGA